MVCYLSEYILFSYLRVRSCIYQLVLCLFRSKCILLVFYFQFSHIVSFQIFIGGLAFLQYFLVIEIIIHNSHISFSVNRIHALCVLIFNLNVLVGGSTENDDWTPLPHVGILLLCVWWMSNWRYYPSLFASCINGFCLRLFGSLNSSLLQGSVDLSMWNSFQLDAFTCSWEEGPQQTDRHTDKRATKWSHT